MTVFSSNSLSIVEFTFDNFLLPTAYTCNKTILPALSKPDLRTILPFLCYHLRKCSRSSQTHSCSITQTRTKSHAPIIPPLSICCVIIPYLLTRLHEPFPMQYCRLLLNLTVPSLVSLYPEFDCFSSTHLPNARLRTWQTIEQWGSFDLCFH